MSAQAATCHSCGAHPIAGRFCRTCGTPLPMSSPEPARPAQAMQWGPPPAPPPSQPPPYAFLPPPAPQPRQLESSALAAIVATALLLVLLGVAATVILLVANDDPGHTGVVTQSTVNSSVQAQQTTP